MLPSGFLTVISFFAQVGFNNFGITHDILIVAFGDFFAIIQHNHPVTNVTDEIHFVFYQQNGVTAFIAHAADDLGDFVGFFGVHARTWFV